MDALSPLHVQRSGKREVRLLSPLTTSGTIKVGPAGLKASCYSLVRSQSLLHAYTRFRNMVSPFKGDLTAERAVLTKVLALTERLAIYLTVFPKDGKLSTDDLRMFSFDEKSPSTLQSNEKRAAPSDEL